MKKLNLCKFIIMCIIIAILGLLVKISDKNNEQPIQDTEYTDSLFFEN